MFPFGAAGGMVYFPHEQEVETMLKLLFWPVDLAMRLMGLILSMTGRILSFVLGIILCGLGAALCATVVGLVAGVPLCVFGGGLMLKSIF